MLHHCQERALGPVPQRMSFLASQAVQPVHKRLIENGATSQMKLLWGVGALASRPPEKYNARCPTAYNQVFSEKNCRLSEVETGFLTTNFFMWYPPRDLSVESIPNLKSKILKKEHLSVGSPLKSKI